MISGDVLENEDQNHLFTGIFEDDNSLTGLI
jgi:hypothetical protein